jgi:hypothetical protein
LKRVALIAVINIGIALLIGWLGGNPGFIIGATLIVVTTGGVIAYIGDKIGYSLGKKRVSLFGYRPRETANMIGVTTGAVSALAVFGLLLAVTPIFRRALFEGNTLIKNNAELRRQNISNHERLHESAQKLSLALLAEKKAGQDAATANVQFRLSQGRLHRARREFEQASKSLLLEKENLSLTKADLKEAQNILHEKEAAYNIASQNLFKANYEVKTARNQVRLLDSQIKKQTVILNAIANHAHNIISIGRGTKLIYNNGQEVGRVVISNSSTLSISRALYRFLVHLSNTAIDAGSGKAGHPRAVQLATVEVTSKDSNEKTGEDVGEDELLDALADQIHSSGDNSVVVVATAYGNSFQDQPVILQMQPFRNQLAIRKGTLLGQLVIRKSSTKDADAVITKIQQFLISQVKPAAIDAGVVPIEEYAGAPPQTGEEPVGDIFNVVRQIQDANDDVIVSVTAARDIWSADQLKLKFTVTSGSVKAYP